MCYTAYDYALHEAEHKFICKNYMIRTARGDIHMKNVVFIGMPASGKSTVGVVVAKRLGFDFIDSDLLIQKQEGKLLSEIIEEVGNDGFLAIENQVNRDIETDRSVISPGGSVVYCEEAMEHFKKIATIVYLKVSFENLKKRIRSLKKRGVVLKKGQTFRDLYEERAALFEKYADITIDEDDCQRHETVENVLFALQEYWKWSDEYGRKM